MTGDVRVVCRPLTDWPGQMHAETDRAQARFTATWTDTQRLLVREAEMLGAREIVIRLAVPDSEIRVDGWPYARAKPRHPGVTVVLPDTHQGRLSWSTDRYTDSHVYVSARVRQARSGNPDAKGGDVTVPGWQANVRAVALSMEALRAADRHGIMQGRQYAGFRELGAGDNGSQMTVEEAARFIVNNAKVSSLEDPDAIAEDIIAHLDQRAVLYRSAVKRLHPDRGGDPDRFRRLEAAKALLDGAGQ